MGTQRQLVRYAGLVAAILDNPTYELLDLEQRLRHRLRLADDCVLLAELSGQATPSISDRDGTRTINVSSDERFVRSLDHLGFISLDPLLRGSQS